MKDWGMRGFHGLSGRAGKETLKLTFLSTTERKLLVFGHPQLQIVKAFVHVF